MYLFFLAKVGSNIFFVVTDAYCNFILDGSFIFFVWQFDLSFYSCKIWQNLLANIKNISIIPKINFTCSRYNNRCNRCCHRCIRCSYRCLWQVSGSNFEPFSIRYVIDCLKNSICINVAVSSSDDT